jgi:hypothetical protein
MTDKTKETMVVLSVRMPKSLRARFMGWIKKHRPGSNKSVATREAIEKMVRGK